MSTGGDPETDQIFDEIAHFPQVVATSRSSLFLGTVTARRHTVSFPDVLLVAPHEAEGFDADGVKVVRGRLADPEAVDEAVVGYAFAERLGLSPGDTMTVSVASPGGEVAHRARASRRRSSSASWAWWRRSAASRRSPAAASPTWSG